MPNSKNSFYFSHDYNSRNDPKLQAILMEMGLEGIGIFWCLVEMLYEQGGKLSIEECERYAFSMRTDKTKILRVIELVFDVKENKITSKSVNRRLKQREEKSEKARKSARTRWNKKDANALRTQSDGNAIKERKGKEIKEYINIYNSLFKSTSTVTSGRSVKYLARLKKFTHEQIIQALNNLAKSDFHTGKNDNGWVADPDFLIRSDEQVDKWLNYKKTVKSGNLMVDLANAVKKET